ncbi:hypothetical protein LEMLEM_LOCUS27613 [Lemmus lemmus]
MCESLFVGMVRTKDIGCHTLPLCLLPLSQGFSMTLDIGWQPASSGVSLGLGSSWPHMAVYMHARDWNSGLYASAACPLTQSHPTTLGTILLPPSLQEAVVVHTFNPSTLEAEVGGSL